MRHVTILVLGAVLAGMLAGAAVLGQNPISETTRYGYSDPALSQNVQWATKDGMNYYRSDWQGQSSQLAQQYAKADKEDDKSEIRKKLVDVLSKEFDAHIKQQQKELEDLEKQIAKLRALVRKRLDSKDKIVDRRLEQLIQEAEGLGWNAPGSSGNRAFYEFSNSRPSQPKGKQ